MDPPPLAFFCLLSLPEIWYRLQRLSLSAAPDNVHRSCARVSWLSSRRFGPASEREPNSRRRSSPYATNSRSSSRPRLDGFGSVEATARSPVRAIVLPDPGDGRGVIFLIDAQTVEEAHAVSDAMPLSKENLMDHQYIPVGPLMPLAAWLSR